MNKNSLSTSESSFNCIDHTTTQNPTRPRKCCPFCGSTKISRRVRLGGWHCNNKRCKRSFKQPVIKLVSINKGSLPAALKARGAVA